MQLGNLSFGRDSKDLYIVCSVAGLCIAGLLGYFGAHIPLRVVLFGVGLSTITLFIIFLWIERWLKKHY